MAAATKRAPATLDGEHLFKVLVKEIRQSGYMSADDDVSTTGGTIQAAIMVIGRMADDLRVAKAK